MRLTHLKTIADKYKWTLLANRITTHVAGVKKHIEKNIPNYLAQSRKVIAKDSKGMLLETNINGATKKVGLLWPKASELTVEHSGFRLIVTINKTIPKDENMGRSEDAMHTMIYELITDHENEL